MSQEVRRRGNRDLYAYNYSFRDEFTDEEIEHGFLMAKTLGVTRITASANVDISPRVDKYAQQYKIIVGYHNHDSMKPNEFSTPDDWKSRMVGRSKYIGINLDIGHFTAAGFDPVSFLEEHHASIVTLHIKDRKKNHGPNMPFGEGDTNIKGVLAVSEDQEVSDPGHDRIRIRQARHGHHRGSKEVFRLLQGRAGVAALGQHIRELFDPCSLGEARRRVAADAFVAVQAEILEIVHYMQAGVSVAFHAEHFVARAQALLKNWHAEKLPEQIAIVLGKTRSSAIGEYDHRMAELQTFADGAPKLLDASGN